MIWTILVFAVGLIIGVIVGVVWTNIAINDLIGQHFGW